MLMIFGACWLSAALLSWFLYAKIKAPETVKSVKILAAVQAMPAGTRIRKTDLKAIAVPETAVPAGALTSVDQAVDRALLFPMSENESLTVGKLSTAGGAEGVPAMIEQGKRAMSVPITDVSGVAGLIQPRAHVDVLFTRLGSVTESATAIILQDVVVLSIGRVTEVNQVVDPKAPRLPTQAATLLVTPSQAAKLELAKNQGRITLSLRNPLDRSTVTDPPVMADTLDPSLYERIAKAKRMSRAGGDVRNDQEWARLTGEAPRRPKPVVVEKKEPPKPRWVVDVYRGDKHLQETFQ